MLDVIAEILYQMEEEQWVLTSQDFKELVIKNELAEKMAEVKHLLLVI